MNDTIKRRLEIIDGLKDEVKVLKGSIEDCLSEYPELRNLQDQIKDLKHRYSLVKESALNEPEERALVSKLKDAQDNLKSEKELLSSDLIGKFITDNSLDIHLDGGRKSIKLTAKLT